MRLLDLLAEALSAEKEAALKQKYVVGEDEKGFQPNKMTQKEFDSLVDVDDTPNGKYINWIIPRYVKLDRIGRAKFFSEKQNEKLKNSLEFFEKNAKNIKRVIADFKNDINQYKTFDEFNKEIEDAKTKTGSGIETKANLGPTKLQGAYIDPIKILGATPSGFAVYRIPKECRDNKDCERKYLNLTGCGDPNANFYSNKENEPAPASGYRVTWCTRNTYQFNNHLSSGPMYLFKNWDTRRQFQLHYESGQLKDESNSSVSYYNQPRQNEFLQFLLDKEGRIPPSSMNFDLDLSKFKIDEIDGQNLYKIGPYIYIEGQGNSLLYFDINQAAIKDARNSGTRITLNNALKPPYDKLMKYLVEKDMYHPTKDDMEKFVNWNMILLFGGLKNDGPFAPEKKKRLNGSIKIDIPTITQLPKNLIIDGNLILTGSGIKEIPSDLIVTGLLDVTGTGISEVPNRQNIGQIKGLS